MVRSRNWKTSICLAAGVLVCGMLMGTGTAYGAGEQEQMYGIGSTSKVFVAASVMKLSEEGKIDMEAPLTDYIPEFEMKDPRYQTITPKMLLNHSSGLQGSTLTNAMLLGEGNTDNHDRLLERLKTQRLKGEPGAWAVYCNDGFTLAEILVERVTGMTYTEYLEQTFFAPLGLQYVKTPQSRMEDGALAPIYDGNTGKELPPEHPNVIGSGGMFATAEDLCRLSAVFMHEDGGHGFLSEESLKAMETDAYGIQMNPEGRDSSWSFGLGWDSVSAYPFNRYGIKALVKGGNTSYYRASLTVLPEEGISCAVLTSGGGSGLNQIAVQEILMEYLEETGRIRRRDENPFAMDPAKDGEGGDAAPVMPEEIQAYSGWYAGQDMLKAEIREDGTLTLSAKGADEGNVQTYQYQEDGKFYGKRGDYLSTAGELVKGSDGKIGTTALGFMKGEEGCIYLTATTYETYPGLGSIADHLPAAEKVEANTVDADILNAWERRHGKEYYLVSERYSSTAYTTTFSAKLNVLSEPSGYLVFEQAKLSMARLAGEELAEFFVKIPGQIGRDSNDYRIVQKNGKEYLDYGAMRLIADDCIEDLPETDGKVSIGNDGDTIWFKTAGQQVAVDVPEKGAYYIYNHGSREMTCIASSYVLEKGRKILLPKDGRIAFAGEAGETFRIRYH